MALDHRIAVAGALVLGVGIGVVGRAQLDTPPAPRGTASAAPSTPPAPPAPPSSSASAKETFEQIYKTAAWGTNFGDAGTSGYGSTMEATEVYRTFLAAFMKEAHVKTVVDAGCGDWESTQAIDWKGIDYKGYDVVDAVIQADRRKFEKPNVHFFTADIVEAELPAADLLIVKEVLQHLPSAMITKFFRQLPKYKHVLLTNGVDATTLTADNQDISLGMFRYLDPTRPPFNLAAAKPLTYWTGGDMAQVVYVQGYRLQATRGDAGTSP